MTLLQKYRGALLGLAAGDAVGTTLEFTKPGSFEPITDMVGGGPFNLQPGEWTDDTSMTLCLAASLVEKEMFDPIDQLERYWRWYREGYMSSTGRCFDIGNTVRRALTTFKETGEPYCGSINPNTAGNGSIMRLAPVPLFYAKDPALAIEKSGESSRTTHGAPAAVDACRYLGGLLVGAVQGVDKATLLSARYSPVPGYWEDHPLMPDIDEVAAGSFKVRQPPNFTPTDPDGQAVKGMLSTLLPASLRAKDWQIQGSGYVVKSLEAALWAFYRSESFEEGCLLAVNLGDDADTTGAVYGQLAGAFYGEAGIPETWRAKIAKRTVIERLAEEIFKQAAPQ